VAAVIERPHPLPRIFHPAFRSSEMATFRRRRAQDHAGEAKRTAYVECPRCGGVLADKDKADLNASAVFVAPGQSVTPDGDVIGEAPDSSTLSFWVSGLASPFVTFGQRAENYLAAVREGS
jgi:phage terminase large subunit GpA-like protein